MKTKDEQLLDCALELHLVNDKYYTLEDLSEELKYSRADIHRAFARLKMKNGWSITPNNDTPYWRQHWRGWEKTPNNKNPVTNRGRKKGEVYAHDSSEPDWSRTSFYVLRPNL